MLLENLEYRYLTLVYFFRYATESSKDACKWAYEDASEGSVLDGKLSENLEVELCYLTLFYTLFN
jgi:hypothetical protein